MTIKDLWTVLSPDEYIRVCDDDDDIVLFTGRSRGLDAAKYQNLFDMKVTCIFTSRRYGWLEVYAVKQEDAK